jgi:hypothetical protein
MLVCSCGVIMAQMAHGEARPQAEWIVRGKTAR